MRAGTLYELLMAEKAVKLKMFKKKSKVSHNFINLKYWNLSNDISDSKNFFFTYDIFDT